MRFVWVNGRMPASSSVCAACGRPIRASYLRHIGTRLLYCDPDCGRACRCGSRPRGLAGLRNLKSPGPGALSRHASRMSPRFGDDHAIGPFNQHEAGAILKSVLEPFQEVRGG